MQMPVSFGPREFDPRSYARLVKLTRWSEEPDLPRPERWKVPILALASAGAIFMLAASVSEWAPMVGLGHGAATLASYQSDSLYIPTTWNSSRF